MTNIVWQNSVAQVWCWAAEDGANKKHKYVAETRFFARPEDVGQLQLLGCSHGYEAQYWLQGFLKESHWWEEKPGQSAWRNFQRAAGLDAQEELPVIVVEKLAQPWGKDYKLDQNALFISLESMLWKAFPVALAFLLSWQGTQIYLLQQDIKAQHLQQSEISRQIEPILQTRNKIQDDQRFLNQVAGLWKGHRQLQLLAQIVAKLPDPANMKIMLWEYSSEQLRFIIQTTNTDPSLFVKTYSDFAWGKEVSAQPDTRMKQITVTIRFQADADV